MPMILHHRLLLLILHLNVIHIERPNLSGAISKVDGQRPFGGILGREALHRLAVARDRNLIGMTEVKDPLAPSP